MTEPLSPKNDESIKRWPARRIDIDTQQDSEELLALEAPLHIRVNGESFTTTMRTPGADEELARGLLFSEGIVPDADARESFVTTPDPETGLIGRIDVTLPAEQIAMAVEGRRTQMSSASCGVCGTREPADIAVYGPALRAHPEVGIDASTITACFEHMQAAQTGFAVTGGYHAAALQNADAEVLAVFEDIGRHNAVDKAIGSLLAAGRLDEASILTVSGRLSYEIIYKVYRASIPIVLAVSAPSSLAVETADRMGVTLAGFCRDGRATVYTHPERITH